MRTLTHTQPVAVTFSARVVQTERGAQVAVGLLVLAALPAWLGQIQQLWNEAVAIGGALVELCQACGMATAVFWNVGEVVFKSFAWGVTPCRV